MNLNVCALVNTLQNITVNKMNMSSKW